VAGPELNSQPPYGLPNGRLSLMLDLPRSDNAPIGIWGKNITHKEYKQHVIVAGTAVTTTVQPAGTATMR
jgi:hypothetical protein